MLTAEAQLGKRNAAVIEAVRLGATHAEIADEMGVSRARAGQVIQAALKAISNRPPDDDGQDFYTAADLLTPGPGDDPSGLERASRRRSRADQRGGE